MKKGLRICKRSNPAGTKVNQGAGWGSPGAGAEGTHRGSILFLKNCTLWKGLMLEHFMKGNSLWEGVMSEKFIENWLPWKGFHVGEERGVRSPTPVFPCHWSGGGKKNLEGNWAQEDGRGWGKISEDLVLYLIILLCSDWFPLVSFAHDSNWWEISPFS